MTPHDAESADALLAELSRLRSDVIAAHASRDQALRAAEAANAAAALLLKEQFYKACMLIGRLDYFLETYARRSMSEQRRLAAQLRREIAEQSNTK